MIRCRFAFLVLLSAGIHAWVLGAGSTSHSPQGKVAHGRISVELMESASAANQDVESQAEPVLHELSPADFASWLPQIQDEVFSKRPVDGSRPSFKPAGTRERHSAAASWRERHSPQRRHHERFPEPMIAAREYSPSMAPRSAASPPSEQRIEGVRTQARLLGTQTPTYPSEARRQGIEGLAIVRIDVSASGAVIDAVVETSSGHTILDESTLRFARNLRFEPARQGAAPIAASVLLPVRYVLVDSR
jgi:TonB family protein